MPCDRSPELISAYVDGELGPDERRDVAAHLETCPACAAQAADIGEIARVIASSREPLPKSLALRIHDSLAAADSATVVALPVRRQLSLPRGPWRQIAALIVACVIASAATWWVVGSETVSARLDQEVVTAHIRSLLQDSPIQVASSNSHTVKPWFAGRVEFSPEVKDLTLEGFPLIGGRLDFLNGRRIGAVVYRRGGHLINVFAWPAADGGEGAPQVSSYNGYNMIGWRKGGIAYRAVSDLNSGELRQFQSLL